MQAGLWISQRKMLQFSAGALLLLLLPWFGGLVCGEISEDFSECLQFFYQETPPQGINAAGYQPICQRYKNVYRFASLYHCQDRAPLYSAYIVKPADGDQPKDPWMYEPQLAAPEASPEMQPFPVSEETYSLVMESQAVLQDYKNSGYTRGHLNPSSHQETMTDREVTFTLTNIVPQQEGSNGHTWNILENKVLKVFKQYCKGSMFVITGVMPYESEPRRINNRVSVPEYMWSAYCCPSYSNNLPESVQLFFPTYAAVGRNDCNSGGEIVPINVKTKASVRGYDVRQMPLETLEDILAQRLAMPISLFHGRCQEQRVN